MGTFAGIIIEADEEKARIPTEKVEKFEKQLERLYQEGGMMEMSYVSMFGINIETIRKAVMSEEGMDFTYNYYEDDFWENAGYNREKHRVYSNKVGWSKFNAVVKAAYVLEAMYLDSPAAAEVNGKPVNPRRPASWIVGLFGGPLTGKGTGPWELYEMLRSRKGSDWNEEERSEMEDAIMNYADGEAGYEEWLSAAAVEKGTVEFAKEIGSENPKEGSIGWLVNGLRNILHKFHYPKGTVESNGSAAEVMNLLQKYYGTDMDEKEFEQECQRAGVPVFGAVVALLDMPPVVVKLIAEEYDEDFWMLWNSIRDDVRKSGKHRSGEPWEESLEPISTMEYLNLSEDDMIPYWDDMGSLQFSKELEIWFAEMKKKYDAVMDLEEKFGAGNPVRWILELAEYASKEYGHIYVFDDFLNETISHISDRRYLALWAVYEQMLHDPELEKAGSVIFEDEENTGCFQQWWQPRRSLKGSWCVMDPHEKRNVARVTLRNYMALVGNRKLRERVFGF